MLTHEDIARLAQSLRGDLITPSDTGYGQTRVLSELLRNVQHDRLCTPPFAVARWHTDLPLVAAVHA